MGCRLCSRHGTWDKCRARAVWVAVCSAPYRPCASPTPTPACTTRWVRACYVGLACWPGQWARAGRRVCQKLAAGAETRPNRRSLRGCLAGWLSICQGRGRAATLSASRTRARRRMTCNGAGAGAGAGPRKPSHPPQRCGWTGGARGCRGRAGRAGQAADSAVSCFGLATAGRMCSCSCLCVVCVCVQVYSMHAANAPAKQIHAHSTCRHIYINIVARIYRRGGLRGRRGRRLKIMQAARQAGDWDGRSQAGGVQPQPSHPLP